MTYAMCSIWKWHCEHEFLYRNWLLVQNSYFHAWISIVAIKYSYLIFADFTIQNWRKIYRFNGRARHIQFDNFFQFVRFFLLFAGQWLVLRGLHGNTFRFFLISFYEYAPKRYCHQIRFIKLTIMYTYSNRPTRNQCVHMQKETCL